MAKIKKMSLCHPELIHHSKGLCYKCYNKQRWRKKTVNREKANASSRAYYATHKDVITKRRMACYAANPEEFKRRNKQWLLRNPEYLLWKSAKVRAIKKNLDFNIEREDVKIPKECPVLGIPMIPFSGKFAHNSPSIDRIDNTRGYTKDNIIIVSFRANSIKWNATNTELQKVADFYNTLERGKTCLTTI